MKNGSVKNEHHHFQV